VLVATGHHLVTKEGRKERKKGKKMATQEEMATQDETAE